MTTPYYQSDGVTLHLGDCLSILPTLPDASVDAVVTDPPYNLSDSGKRDLQCLRRVIAEFSFPDNQKGNAELSQRGDLAAPALSSSSLGGEDGAVRVDARIGMPEGSVDLQNPGIAQHEVHVGHETSLTTANGDLSTEGDTQPSQFIGDYVLELADGGDAPFCDGTCGCFTEPSAGLIAVTVALACSSAGDLASYLFGSRGRRDADIGIDHDPGRQSKRAASVMAGAGAVVHAVLCLDLARRTGELRPAHAASEKRALFLLTSTETVGAAPRTSRLAAVAEPGRISLVDDSADRAFALHFPWHELKSSRRTGGFMGKEWDGWESPAAFQRWCVSWARECLRVLKPGGYLVAFGSPRTYHRLAVAIEDAGFEVRDSIHWLFGSGFPKSLDVSKAIDARRDDRAGVKRVAAFLKAAADRVGMTAADLDAVFGFAGHMAGQWLTQADWVLLPRWEQWLKLRELLGFGDELDAEVWRLNGRKGTPGNPRADRVVTAPGTGVVYQPVQNVRSAGTPVLEAADRWSGWGTALKPAHEPIVLARKPLAGTVAGNVLEHGTGALNIGSCRVEWDGASLAKDTARRQQPRHDMTSGRLLGGASGEARGDAASPSGRWPTNVVFSHPPLIMDGEVVGDACADGCVPGCPVAELDQQSGVTKSSGGARGGHIGVNGVFGQFEHNGPRAHAGGLGDVGGASRFFPSFRYEAKAPASERPRLPDGTAHTTVKPLALMQWLVRLITPPGGTVLDPFAGSGTTGEACVIEGFRAVLIEREAPHAELIKARLAKPIAPVLDLGEAL